VKLTGEYWVQDGFVQFADGDIGDLNHEGYVVQYVFGQYADDVQDLAEELDVDAKCTRYGEADEEAIQETLTRIYEKLTGEDRESDEDDPNLMSGPEADAYIMKSLGCNEDAFEILSGHGDGRDYAMKHLGWIAIRSNNVQFYGWNTRRKEEIASAVHEIISQEDYRASEDLDPNEVELWLEDLATGKTWSTTLAELEQEEPVANFKTAYPDISHAGVTATYDPRSRWGILSRNPKDSEENKYTKPAKSKNNPWNKAAKKYGLGSELWRGQSESFKEWLFRIEMSK
jgi:hypothetical protein